MEDLRLGVMLVLELAEKRSRGTILTWNGAVLQMSDSLFIAYLLGSTTMI